MTVNDAVQGLVLSFLKSSASFTLNVRPDRRSIVNQVSGACIVREAEGFLFLPEVDQARAMAAFTHSEPAFWWQVHETNALSQIRPRNSIWLVNAIWCLSTMKGKVLWSALQSVSKALVPRRDTFSVQTNEIEALRANLVHHRYQTSLGSLFLVLLRNVCQL